MIFQKKINDIELEVGLGIINSETEIESNVPITIIDKKFVILIKVGCIGLNFYNFWYSM